jgi:hypothetical protein
MATESEQLREDLRLQLRHRLRPLTGIVPRGGDRQVTPLELLYDLTYVIAFAAAAEELTASLASAHFSAGIGAYAFAIFASAGRYVGPCSATRGESCRD